MSIRLATRDDVDALAPVLARAFHANPAMSWAYANERTRPRWARRFFAWQLGRLIPQDVTWTTAGRDGAALWALPGRWRESAREMLRLAVATFPGYATRAPRILSGMAALETHHPEDDHLYLSVLGVDPARQGQGLGSQLMRPGLDVCDRDGLPAYLETDIERNVAFYARHGFRVTGKLRMPGGPTLWLMWREPA